MSKNFLQWKNEFNIGFEHVDNQHKELVNMINELYTAFMNKEHNAKVVVIINKMATYAQSHFAAEEALFEKYCFELTSEHVAEHNAFIAKVADFKEALEKNTATLTFKVITFLQKWLVNHILVEDRKYKPMLAKAGLMS